LAAIIVVLLASVALAGLVVAEETRVRRSMGSRLLGRKVELVAVELSAYFTPIVNALETISAWGRNPELQLTDPGALDSLLVPVIEPIAAVSALWIIDAHNEMLRLARSTDGWEMASKQGSTELPSWCDELRATRLSGEPLWFDADSVDGDFVVALRVEETAARNPNAVFALTVSHESLEDRVASLPLMESGEFLLRRADGRLLRYSAASKELLAGVDQGEFTKPSQLAPPVAHALFLWRERGGPPEPFELTVAGSRWWAAFIPIDDRVTTVLGVVVPQAELLRDLRRAHAPLIWLLAIFVSSGVALIVSLAVVNSRRLRRLARDRGWVSASPTELEGLVRAGESDQVEFKSTLRWNLRRDTPAKEVEISAMKTMAAFLNSQGGTLLIGVADDGELLGIGNDQFTNEDRFMLHFNNLLKEHVGLENLAFLDFDLRSVGGKRILVVDCSPATEAVFLRVGRDEKFFIRVGPGSRELAPSQIVDYLKNRE
jgi:hypothetical protein